MTKNLTKGLITVVRKICSDIELNLVAKMLAMETGEFKLFIYLHVALHPLPSTLNLPPKFFRIFSRTDLAQLSFLYTF